MAYVSTADLAREVAVAAPAPEDEFRIGRVFTRTASIVSRNFPTFFTVAAVAALPTVLIQQMGAGKPGVEGTGLLLTAAYLAMALGMVSQAIILYGAFRDMRGNRVSLLHSLGAVARRLLAIIGLVIVMALGTGFGFVLLVVPGFILMTMWFVAIPVCVVEQKGPLASLGRSSEITKGHRWPIFGIWLLMTIGSGIVAAVIAPVLALTGSAVLTALGTLAWSGAWGAFYAVFVVVMYHDLRVAKEGIDIHQLAAVFD
jgi:MFS family permease